MNCAYNIGIYIYMYMYIMVIVQLCVSVWLFDVKSFL